MNLFYGLSARSYIMADFGWKNGLVNTSVAGNTAVSTGVALNPWGRANTNPSVMARNLHRTDLWYVDLATAVKSVKAVFPQTGNVTPVYCKSVTLPETRVKPEVFKRDGIAFNMPGWDDPLDPITLVLWMESVTPNPVLRFFSDWLSIVRAGRGERYTDGYSASANELTLDDNYGFDLTYSLAFKIWLLQGASVSPQQAMAAASAQSAPQTNASTTAALAQNVAAASSSFCQLVKVTGFETRGWLGSMKIGDLTYEGSQILTCEVKIYPEYLNQSA